VPTVVLHTSHSFPERPQHLALLEPDARNKSANPALCQGSPIIIKA